jgi:hypothetical protein
MGVRTLLSPGEAHHLPGALFTLSFDHEKRMVTQRGAHRAEPRQQLSGILIAHSVSRLYAGSLGARLSLALGSSQLLFSQALTVAGIQLSHTVEERGKSGGNIWLPQPHRSLEGGFQMGLRNLHIWKSTPPWLGESPPPPPPPVPEPWMALPVPLPLPEPVFSPV